jgi:hypothetical protein
MQLKPALLALGLAISAAPLSAQMNPRDPSDRRTTQSGTIGDIIFGSGTANTTESCRVRDARTPDGRIVQICDDRRGRDDDDNSFENRRDGRGRRAHVNDRDGDGDFDARDRAIRKREHQLQKQQRKVGKQRMKAARIHD